MPEPPAQNKSPNGCNRRGLKETKSPSPKELDMKNIVHAISNVTCFVPNRSRFVPNRLSPNHTAEIIRFVPSSRRTHPLLTEALASNEFSPMVKRRIVEAVKIHPDGMDVIEVALLINLAKYWSTDSTQQMGA